MTGFPAQARLVGRVALITGGARGQGASHARRLATEGAAVVIADVLDDAGEQEAERLRADGLDVRYTHLDVTDESQWITAMQTVDDAHGRLDVLINNAGIIHAATVENEDLQAWRQLLDVNLTGAFLGTRAAIPMLRSSGHGVIVNISSIFGPSGAIGNAAYAASKAGILGMTRSTALELAADSIRVVAVCPGGVSTPMNEHEKEGGVIPETPLGRRAHVSEISAAVAFLASDDASFITGTEIYVDGGFRAR
jgi:3alpha(or 20beta)-hydroxysteroid dehydrogenase